MAHDPPPGTSGRRTLELRNHSDCRMTVRVAYHTRTKSGAWQWFNTDFATSWTFEPGEQSRLNHDDFTINADYIRFTAKCVDGSGEWTTDEDEPLYIGAAGSPGDVVGTYTHTLWSEEGIHRFADQHTRRYLRVLNKCSFPITIWVGYHTKTDSGRWEWFHHDLDGPSWTIEPGKATLLTDSDGFTINADCIRYRAEGGSLTWGPKATFIGDFTGEGGCHDKASPYTLSLTSGEEDLTPYDPATVDAFRDLASATGGRSFQAATAAELPGAMLQAIRQGLDGFSAGESADIAIVLDTTGSMADDIFAVRNDLKKLLGKLASYQKQASSLRVGVVLYQDHTPDSAYVTRKYDFTDDLAQIRQIVETVGVSGGGDVPEAVYDGLYVALNDLDWRARHRMGILIGDAPPHPVSPDGHTEETIAALARSKGVAVNLYPIIVGL